jgi:hypothetical protein
MSADTEQLDDGEPDPGDEEGDMRKLRNATAQLMESFDTVQIFATRHVSTDDGTVAVQYGEGNWYARRGQVGEWIVKQDARSAEE